MSDDRERLAAELKRAFKSLEPTAASRHPPAVLRPPTEEVAQAFLPVVGNAEAFEGTAARAQAGMPEPPVSESELASATPISFTPELLKSVVAGTKIETRRPIRPPPASVRDGVPFTVEGTVIAPPVRVGDRLWVREKWARLDDGSFIYAIDGSAKKVCWISSRFMPRAAARHHLRVRSVGVARLNDIHDAAAIREGAAADPSAAMFGPRAWFISVWDSIYGEGEFASANDPWVWAIAFSLE